MVSRTMPIDESIATIREPAHQQAPPYPGEAVASWPAIFAGAFVAVSASLILLSVGSGLGVEVGPSWSSLSTDARALTVSAATWLIVTQWISAGLGGYLAGRLRRRWLGTHAHEVFFRDTAHGLVTWSVATVFMSVVLSASVLRVAGVAAHAPAEAHSLSQEYNTDRLFRPVAATNGVNSTQSSLSSSELHAEAERIADNAFETGSFPDADRTYLQQLVTANTGLAPAEAQQRVAEYVASVTASVARTKAVADEARRMLSESATYIALSLLVGAFIASVSAALGGHLRDQHL